MSRAWSLLRVIHPLPAAIVVVAAGGLILALQPAPDAWRAAAIAWLAIVASQIAVGATNDWLDRHQDRAAGRAGKPLVDGSLSDRAALILAIAGWLGLFLLASLLSGAALTAATIGGLAALAYDLKLRNTAWAWVGYAIAFPSLPIFLSLAVDRFAPLYLALYLPGLPIAFALHTTNVLPDLASEQGTLAARLGLRRARLLAGLAFASGLLVAAAIAALGARLSWPWFALFVPLGLIMWLAPGSDSNAADRNRFRGLGALAGIAALTALLTWA